MQHRDVGHIVPGRGVHRAQIELLAFGAFASRNQRAARGEVFVSARQPVVVLHEQAQQRGMAARHHAIGVGLDGLEDHAKVGAVRYQAMRKPVDRRDRLRAVGLDIVAIGIMRHRIILFIASGGADCTRDGYTTQNCRRGDRPTAWLSIDGPVFGLGLVD